MKPLSLIASKFKITIVFCRWYKIVTRGCEIVSMNKLSRLESSVTT